MIFEEERHEVMLLHSIVGIVNYVYSVEITEGADYSGRRTDMNMQYVEQYSYVKKEHFIVSENICLVTRNHKEPLLCRNSLNE